MRHSWWRTGPPVRHVQPVPRPTGSQVLIQIGVLLFIAAIWGGGFLVLLSVTRPLNVAYVTDLGTPVSKGPSAATIANTPTLAPIRTATSLPTITPTLVFASTVAATAASVNPTRTARPTVAPAATATATLTNTSAVSFARDVLPIFTQVCVKCHGGEKTQKSLVLKSYDDVMQGSEDGPVILPGDPANSVLIDMIVQGKMPKNSPKLLPAQIRVITDWVKAGAPNN